MPRVSPAGKLSFDLRMVAAITIAAVGIAGTQWASLAGLKSEVRNINTLLEERARSEDQIAQLREKARQDREKLEDERAKQLQDSIQAMRNRQEYQQVEIQGLRETILRGQQLQDDKRK